MEQIWASPQGIAPVGFHLRHIAGSIDRLLTYALGRKLDERQTTELRKEMEPGAFWEELFSGLEKALENGEKILRALDPGVLHEPRFVGRRQLPTTLIGLLVHVAEHTQRHVGQAIVTAKLVRQPGLGSESAKTNNPGAEDIGRE